MLVGVAFVWKLTFHPQRNWKFVPYEMRAWTHRFKFHPQRNWKRDDKPRFPIVPYAFHPQRNWKSIILVMGNVYHALFHPQRNWKLGSVYVYQLESQEFHPQRNWKPYINVNPCWLSYCFILKGIESRRIGKGIPGDFTVSSSKELKDIAFSSYLR